MMQVTAEFELSFEPQETFTHSDDEGKLRTFLIGNMQRFVREHSNCVDLVAKRMKIEKSVVRHIRKNMGIEKDRLKRLKNPYLSIPGIGILWPNPQGKDHEMTVVDGNHRIIRRDRLGLRYINMFVFKHPFWENFILPDDVQKKVMEGKDLLNDPSGMIEFETKRSLRQ